jgi:hypothetical protein
MGITPVKNYRMSETLLHLQQRKIADGNGGKKGNCRCTNGMTTSPNNPCCCGTGRTFFANKV